MRKFYIFNINSDTINIKRTHPYALYKMLSEVQNLNLDNFNFGFSICKNIIKPINKVNINDSLYKNYTGNYNYTKFLNTHLYNNYYSNENSKLIVNNFYIELDTTAINSSFFSFLKHYKNLFVCDFENKDYFWLESIA